MNHRIGFVRVKTFKPVFSKDWLNSPHVCVAVSKSCGMIGRNILGTKRATGDSLMSTASDFCTKGHQLGFQWMNMGEKGDDLLKVGRRNSSCEYLKCYLFHLSCFMCGTFIKKIEKKESAGIQYIEQEQLVWISCGDCFATFRTTSFNMQATNILNWLLNLFKMYHLYFLLSILRSNRRSCNDDVH